MRLNLLVILLVFNPFFLHAQEHGFPFAGATYKELDMTSCPIDTSAYAVVLNEFGEAYIDNSNDHNLLFEYHVKIKILKQRGVALANIEIPLHKVDSRFERVLDPKASSFNYENGTMKETKWDPRNQFKENVHKNWDLVKFAIPNVRVGTVIEYRYTLESPFFYNFRQWDFQSEIPKLYSEYWATIPGNYVYNISLRGFLKLTKNQSELIEDCFTPGGGYKADCGRMKWGMKNIPAFVEEDYMTAKSNFLSSIHFELSEIKRFDGSTDKIALEWKDAELELRKNEAFGVQIKKGKDIMEDHLSVLTAGESDPLVKAKKIYEFIRGWYQWNEEFGKYSDPGIRKAFEKKSGNVGDINLSLIAALKFAKLEASPVILSTRDNGFPTELFPVISEFNYVLAHLSLNGKVYLLDATDDFMPFGMIPERCLNGKGRVLADGGSYWMDMKASDRDKTVSILTLNMDASGKISGNVQTSYIGYAAASQRRSLYRNQNEKQYIEKLAHPLGGEIGKYEIQNADDLEKPLVVKLEFSTETVDGGEYRMFNPFLVSRHTQNPFRSSERLYPVDFGVPLEETVILNLSYPSDFEVAEVPPKAGLSLPDNGARFVFDLSDEPGKVTMNSALSVAKPLFTSTEYHHLKELYNRVIAIQQTDLVFKRKP